MKYFLIIFATAVIVFLGATLYYKGFPNFARPQGISVTTSEESVNPLTTGTPTPTPSDENADIVSAIKTALITKHGSDAAQLNVTVYKVQGEYSQGGASGEGGGGIWFAARLNGKWNLVWDGNGIIECQDVSPYPGFPADMIPQCYDRATDKLVKR